ncbi:hypothetical protein BHE74_00029421 [Ensete ventricosum]|nr:hypothetical protein GW17_00043793 [Ensete ventricosum]RWW63403.1 hypothetical protein BHE74_00029421 [Ensete ventricosum]RZR82822.1 hypothetical protein BHM03_00009348 [Ensete ventricosum]
MTEHRKARIDRRNLSENNTLSPLKKTTVKFAPRNEHTDGGRPDCSKQNLNRNTVKTCLASKDKPISAGFTSEAIRSEKRRRGRDEEQAWWVFGRR